jgi:hypothetical protein
MQMSTGIESQSSKKKRAAYSGSLHEEKTQEVTSSRLLTRYRSLPQKSVGTCLHLDKLDARHEEIACNKCVSHVRGP